MRRDERRERRPSTRPLGTVASAADGPSVADVLRCAEQLSGCVPSRVIDRGDEPASAAFVLSMFDWTAWAIERRRRRAA